MMDFLLTLVFVVFHIADHVETAEQDTGGQTRR